MLLIRFVRSLVEATVCKSLPSRSDTPACSAPGTVSVTDATMAASTCCRSGSASSDRATSRRACATSTSRLGPDSDGLCCSCGMYVRCSLAEVVEPERLGSSTGAGAEPTLTANQATLPRGTPPPPPCPQLSTPQPQSVWWQRSLLRKAATRYRVLRQPDVVVAAPARSPHPPRGRRSAHRQSRPNQRCRSRSVPGGRRGKDGPRRCAADSSRR